jgi:peptidoglycan/xylan/chitin deacetylase (PgdA/CDA1 family)
VAVTFDDGYADNANTAREILESIGVPATFFISVGLIGRAEERWWDELEAVFHGTPTVDHLTLDIAGRRLRADVRSDAARARAHWAIYHRLRPLHAVEISEVLGQLRTQIDAEPAGRESHRFMTMDELRSCATSPVIEIGGHARTHQLLASLDADAQRDEIVGGREDLRAITSTPVTTFAYPFGGPESFDDRCVQLVDEAGYELAFVGWRGVVRPDSEHFRIPRFVVRDVDEETFAANLESWFTS